MLLFCFFCYLLLCVPETAKGFPDVQLTPDGEYSAVYFSLVDFTCLGTGNDISWRVDNEVLDDEEMESRSITVYKHSAPAGEVSSTLTVLASSENKDVNFACVVTDSSDVNFAYVILRVESMAPVRNLVVKEISDGVLIVWNKPMFVQNLTMIRYGITVTGGGLAIFTANNIEDLQFTVSIDMLSLCSVYSFSVVAYEDSLQSDSISVSFVITGDVSISVEDHHMMYEENSVSIQYFVSVNTLCSGTMTVTTEVDNVMTDEKVLKVNSNVGIYIYIASNLALGITGTVSYVVYDSLGSMKTAINISFATHHVIRVTAFIDGSICVECSFAYGSNALGCEVEFRDRITDECEPCTRFTIYRISNSSSAFKCISHTSEGNFSVVAYDKVDNESSQLRAAVYNDLPKYLIVPADNDHTVIISPSASVPNASSTLEVISLASTRFTNYTVEVSSSSLTETTVPVNTKMSLFLIPVIIIVALFCTLLAVFIMLVIAVRLHRKNFRRKERKRVFEQTSAIAEKNIYQEGGVMLYGLSNRSVGANIKGGGVTPQKNLPYSDSQSNLSYTEEVVGESLTLSYPVQRHACTNSMSDPQRNLLPENQTSSHSSQSHLAVNACPVYVNSSDLSRTREVQFVMSNQACPVYVNSSDLSRTREVQSVTSNQDDLQYSHSEATMEQEVSDESDELVNSATAVVKNVTEKETSRFTLPFSSYNIESEQSYHVVNTKGFLETDIPVQLPKYMPSQSIDLTLAHMNDEGTRKSLSSHTCICDESTHGMSEMVVSVETSLCYHRTVVPFCSKIQGAYPIEDVPGMIENESIGSQQSDESNDVIRQGIEIERKILNAPTDDLQLKQIEEEKLVTGIHVNEKMESKIPCESNVAFVVGTRLLMNENVKDKKKSITTAVNGSTMNESMKKEKDDEHFENPNENLYLRLLYHKSEKSRIALFEERKDFSPCLFLLLYDIRLYFYVHYKFYMGICIHLVISMCACYGLKQNFWSNNIYVMIDVLMDIISSFLLYDPRLYFCLHYKLHDSIWINPVGIEAEEKDTAMETIFCHVLVAISFLCVLIKVFHLSWERIINSDSDQQKTEGIDG